MLGGVHGDGCDFSSGQAASRTVLVSNGPGHQQRGVTEARVVGLRTGGPTRSIPWEAKNKVHIKLTALVHSRTYIHTYPWRNWKQEKLRTTFSLESFSTLSMSLLENLSANRCCSTSVAEERRLRNAESIFWPNIELSKSMSNWFLKRGQIFT